MKIIIKKYSLCFSFLILFLSFFLISCGSSEKAISRFAVLRINTYENSNNNNSVRIQLVQLVDTTQFSSLSREELSGNLANVLTANTMIGQVKPKEWVLIPKSRVEETDYLISANANYIGVVVDFLSVENDSWRQVHELSEEAEGIQIKIYENSFRIESLTNIEE
jgi:type VI secretion system VasD/TssJ family lipoprotein